MVGYSRSWVGTFRLFTTAETTDWDWETRILELGLGLFRVRIDATVGHGPLGDIAVDDIIWGPCDHFGKDSNYYYYNIYDIFFKISYFILYISLYILL